MSADPRVTSLIVLNAMTPTQGNIFHLPVCSVVAEMSTSAVRAQRGAHLRNPTVESFRARK